MVNRGHKQSFMALDSERIEQIIGASRAGLKWRSYEDAAVISMGSEDNLVLDAELAAQLGRTPGAVRARRAKLKEMGKL